MAFPSTFTDLQAKVTRKLRLDTSNATDVQDVKDWLNQTYAKVVLETEALQQAATMALTPNVSSYTLPSAIIRIKWMAAAAASTPTAYGPPLKAVTLEDILIRRQSDYITTATGSSVGMYALVGIQEIEVYPTPTAADILLVYYSYLPTALSAGSDVPVIAEPYASELLEYGALARGGEFVEHPRTEEWAGLYEDALRRFRKQVNRKQGGGTMQFALPGVPSIPYQSSADLRGVNG